MFFPERRTGRMADGDFGSPTSSCKKRIVLPGWLNFVDDGRAPNFDPRNPKPELQTSSKSLPPKNLFNEIEKARREFSERQWILHLASPKPLVRACRCAKPSKKHSKKGYLAYKKLSKEGIVLGRTQVGLSKSVFSGSFVARKPCGDKPRQDRIFSSFVFRFARFFLPSGFPESTSKQFSPTFIACFGFFSRGDVVWGRLVRARGVSARSMRS